METFYDVDLHGLVARVRDGDVEAWVVLTDRFTGLLWSIARGMRLSEADAADAVQATWLRLAENLDSVREPERLGGWLAATVRRECDERLRRSERVRPGGRDAAGGWNGVLSVADPLDEALLHDGRDAALWRALGSLEPFCQRLLRVLMAYPPPSYAEVSAALDVPVGSIGPSRQRCLECLREILLADEGPLEGRPEARGE